MKNVIFLSVLLLFSVASSAQYYPYTPYTQTIRVRDGAYYKRLDEIAQQDYDTELAYLEKSMTYADSGDYESAIYYCRKVTKSKELFQYKYYNLVTTYALWNDMGRARASFAEGREFFDPEHSRKLKELLTNRFGDVATKKKHFPRGAIVGIVIGGLAVTAVIVTIIAIIVHTSTF